MNLTNYLEDYFQKGGILKSDKIMLHSNISYLWKKLKKDGLNVSLSDILDSLINYLGEKGLLIVPTFNFSFCEGQKYDAVNTKSQMGSFSENARLKGIQNKTWHPVYSFVMFGNIPEKEIKKINYSAYGKESLFNWITEADGKISIIDLPDQKSMTYYHYVEELKNVSWRYMKTFTGGYKDLKGEVSVANANIFVRRVDLGIETNVNKMEKILWSKSLYSGHNNSSYAGCRSIRVKKLKEEVEKIIDSNQALGTLYNIRK